jgi:hypothetical protein
MKARSNRSRGSLLPAYVPGTKPLFAELSTVNPSLNYLLYISAVIT